jgi:hypothetical protein
VGSRLTENQVGEPSMLTKTFSIHNQNRIFFTELERDILICFPEVKTFGYT